MLDFHDFLTRFLLTVLNYDVTNCKFPGDNKMRKCNKLSKKQHASKLQKRMVEITDGTISVRSRGRRNKVS